MEPRLCWMEPRVTPPARPPTLRPSLRRTVHRVPPKWEGRAEPWSRFCGTCRIRWRCRLSPTGARVAARTAARLAGPRLQAAADGAAVVAIVERAATTLHVVHQALLLRPQLLVALLQPPAFLAHSLLQTSPLPLQSLPVLRLALLLHVAVAQVHLCHVRQDETNDARTRHVEHRSRHATDHCKRCMHRQQEAHQ
eukprot:scaffold44051_cov60-Phaeocystis_antarctica.AAC.1